MQLERNRLKKHLRTSWCWLCRCQVGGRGSGVRRTASSGRSSRESGVSVATNSTWVSHISEEELTDASASEVELEETVPGRA